MAPPHPKALGATSAPQLRASTGEGLIRQSYPTVSPRVIEGETGQRLELPFYLTMVTSTTEGLQGAVSMVTSTPDQPVKG